MRLLITLCLVGVAMSVPMPGHRYAYRIPQDGKELPWSQFNERADDRSYSWGYEYPSRVHFESKDPEGIVKGSFGFVDANGVPVVWQYTSHPNTGFEVNIGEAAVKPGEPEEVSLPYFRQEEPIPAVDVRTEQVEQSISPSLRQAAASGYIIPVGSSPSGTPQFGVHPKLVEEVGGSISELAFRLGAIPPAAVHDVQSPYGRPGDATFYSASDAATQPLLNYVVVPEGIMHTLEVPLE